MKGIKINHPHNDNMLLDLNPKATKYNFQMILVNAKTKLLF